MVGVRDIAADVIRLYIDGGLVSEVADTTTGSITTSQNGWLVGQINTVTTTFNFLMALSMN